MCFRKKRYILVITIQSAMRNIIHYERHRYGSRLGCGPRIIINPGKEYTFDAKGNWDVI